MPSNDRYISLFVSIVFLVCIAGALWFSGPYLRWGNYAPFTQPEKRIYLMLFLFLAWLLKLLLIDLDAPDALKYKEPTIRSKLKNLETRFHGAIRFLKKTVITRSDQAQSIRLNTLPWYLLIGPSQAGKTSLLTNANINFILQKRMQSVTSAAAEGEQCDWWITRDAIIVDIPGKYLSGQETIQHGKSKLNLYAILWQFFLGLNKHHCGNNGIQGIIMTVPLSEIIKQNDNKHYQALTNILFHRIHELRQFFTKRFPCYIMITKCDLLPGFSEFFADSGNDEITQAWGITLPEPASDEKVYDVINNRFDALIKKLNQQLLWRLHQERNPMARPHIKDFPLQIERVKEYTLDMIKKMLSNQLPLGIKGIYLTSALQRNPKPKEHIFDESETSASHALQIFKEPMPASRAYFIKQFFTHALTTPHVQFLPQIKSKVWNSRIAIAIAIVVIAGSALMLGKDFKQGINQVYTIQNYFTQYQLAIQKNQDPDEHLILTSNLLDTLEATARNNQFRLDSSYLLAFYSNKSQQRATLVYRQALKTILLQQIKTYFEEYLRNPVNRNTELVYAVLKAYLMLGDSQYYQPEFVRQTIQEIMPKALQQKNTLMAHITRAVYNAYSPVQLNPHLITITRKYLTAMPSFQLGYIILKNNNVGDVVQLGPITALNSVFIRRQMIDEIPRMFTAQTFSTILSQATVMAAKEATYGNWIIGQNTNANTTNDTFANTLLEQLRVAYVNNYIDVWESLVANIQLATPKDLSELDSIVVTLMSNNSPLLQLLHMLHDNTYFEPIISSSHKLHHLGLLVEKNNDSENLLYQIFTSLQGLHQYIQTIQDADNEKKAAFEAVSHRMLDPNNPDALAKLWMVAGKCPEPVKTWLTKLSNTAWHFLMQDAGKYLDTSWQENVIRVYQTEIANRYPFSAKTNREIPLEKFIAFFGKPGTLLDFYQNYLLGFIDTSSSDWHWKILNDEKLPFSDTTLRQIQQAINIHQSFFPNDDDKLTVQFILQPYQFGKKVKHVKFTINNKEIVDKKADTHTTHVMSWGTPNLGKKSTYYLTLANKTVISKDYPGEWGWFKLVNQSFESAVNKKELLINLSHDIHTAKYLLSTEGEFNPFLTLNWHHFYLPQKLS